MLCSSTCTEEVICWIQWSIDDHYVMINDLTLSTTNYLYGVNMYDSFSRHVCHKSLWQPSNYLFCRLLMYLSHSLSLEVIWSARHRFRWHYAHCWPPALPRQSDHLFVSTIEYPTSTSLAIRFRTAVQTTVSTYITSTCGFSTLATGDEGEIVPQKSAKPKVMVFTRASP